jgi:dolichyldiphosphatase
MPSTHSASISFYATYIPLACAYLPLHGSLVTGSPFIRTLTPVVVLPWAATVLASRVWLGHHTWAQVFAGAALGLVFGALWFEGWTRGVNEYGWMVERALEPYLRR